MSYFVSLKTPKLSNELQEKYKRYIEESKITSDIIFSSESRWKKQLIDHLRELNANRLAKTSAYPEITLRKILSRNVMLMRSKTYYTTKDPKY